MPAISWDRSTAYDLFVSLYVLHRPDQFGLRPSWAAGVRSRLPAGQREFIEKVQTFLPVPLRWLYLLPAGARDAADAVDALARLPSTERLAALSLPSNPSPELITALSKLPSRQSWSPAELEVIRTHYQRRGISLKPSAFHHLCEAWANPDEFGQRYLETFTSYYHAFFAEEESRIRPALDAGLRRAQNQAQRLPPQALLDALAHGVRFVSLADLDEIILVPSYWSTPLVFDSQVNAATLLVLFGCRPEEEPLIPSESVPEPLLSLLKALADPTRLAILRFLTEAPQTPGELSRRLRLRAPTVIHHLNVLRLTGLVQITLPPEGERCYSLRREALESLLPGIESYLQVQPGKDERQPTSPSASGKA